MSAATLNKAEEGVDNYSVRYWNEYYNSKGTPALLPSTFAKFVHESGHLSEGDSLLDVGCGNGRDTFYFIRNGINAFGVDASSSAIEGNRATANKLGCSNNGFDVCDVMRKEDLEKYSDFDSLYARFFLHAIPKEGQKTFFHFLSNSSIKKVFLELRTLNDPLFQKGEQLSNDEAFTDHYRRFLSLEHVLEEISLLPYEVIYQIEPTDLSPHGDDNPSLGRIIMVRKI